MVKKLHEFNYDEQEWAFECDDAGILYLIRLSHPEHKCSLIRPKKFITGAKQVSENEIVIFLDFCDFPHHYKYPEIIFCKTFNDGITKIVECSSFDFLNDTLLLFLPLKTRVYDLSLDKFVTERYSKALNISLPYKLKDISLTEYKGKEYFFCSKEIVTLTGFGEFLHFLVDVETGELAAPVYSTLRDRTIKLTKLEKLENLIAEEEYYKEIVDSELAHIFKAEGKRIMLSLLD